MIPFILLFKGVDELFEEKIAEISPEYEPWFSPIFEPIGELETFFFSLQAAIGAFLIGYYLGKWSLKRSK
ncbi:MAG: energy-coupling factor ABC transporter substrate-binding protein [Archaeoglobaceae archaeon]|nr:energy-coupling factor ABC transporter substrate-binding protein [Archaeoglobaceae archaeon]MCX8152493.1 energy-coupling factor ABC transporter substrate-binding protein [Archaeoglobaceae archaeon]MDW8013692.1 energy-coupling factor ABC transporter substrate-binding protein [Archaeoglobaceae archaeon]